MSGPAQTSDTPELSGFAFAGDPLDRADALRDQPERLFELWPRARVIVLDREGRAFSDAHGNLAASEGSTLGGGPGTAIFLGLREDIAWFAQEAETVPFDAPGRVDLRKAGMQWPAFEAGVFALARAMFHWRSRNRHCGLCGGPIAFLRAGYQGRCQQCDADHYPRVDPAVIVAVSDGERLLLGRQAAWPAGRYSVIAGFVEPGESLEQTVAREVFEEAHVRVRRCRYLAAQPWPFPGSLMLGFSAEAEPDEPRADDELEDARWFTVEEIGRALERGESETGGLLLSPRLSIARALIEYWYREQQARRT